MKIVGAKNNIKEAVQILKRGGTVVFPTETAYGLAADATNKKAVKHIFKLKERPLEKSLPWIAASLSMTKKYVTFSPPALKLVKKYWPGPLTIVLPRKKGRGTVALRVSGNIIAQKLSADLKKPIISTSANISGEPTCYSAEEVEKQFAKKSLQPDLLLDGGILKKNKPSTIIKIEKNKIVVLRQGAVKI